MEVRVRTQGAAPADRLYLNIGPTLATNEARAQEDQRALAYVVNSRDRGIESLPLRSLKGQRIEEGPLDWVALKSKYFVAAAVIDTARGSRPFGGLIANDVPARYAANLTATLQPSDNGGFSYRIYLGPQEYERLLAAGNKLQDVNPMGWRVFRPILRPLAAIITWALITIHGILKIPYGWVLILFGITIRLAMWPLNAKAMRSQMKSMELQPRLKDIQTRYKDQPDQLQREMLKLYKEEGFNPMGGCLPMLIPMPVLITLFFVFQNFIEFRGVPFLWLPDLSRADPLYILPLLLGGTIFVQQIISMKTMPPNPQMKFMLYFMPLFMVMIFLNLASGLNLYYAAQNLPGFVQQMQLSKERARYQKERGMVATPAPVAPAPKSGAARKKR
jgi:YidC/Oxa1 family membrane protein insertase